MLRRILNWLHDLIDLPKKTSRGAESTEYQPYRPSPIPVRRVSAPSQKVIPSEPRHHHDAKPFSILVADNYKYMDEDAEYIAGEFDTWEEAVTHAKKIVDATVIESIKDGATPEEALEAYKAFGEDPWIVVNNRAPIGEPFSAWSYAKEKCYERYIEQDVNQDATR